MYGVKKHGNWRMAFKTFFMYALTFVPYGLILGGLVSAWWSWAVAYIVMGMGVAGIGLSIMHDANHGAYSKKKWVNSLMGFSMNIIGASAFTWKVQHNVLHHTYTNVHGMDEDISGRGLFRFSPDSKWRKLHRFQWLYAWFFYCLLTISWMFVGDFSRLVRYEKMGLVKKQKTTFKKEFWIMLATKIAYVGYIIVLPLLFSSLGWGQVVLGFVIMHAVAGLSLSLIFQPAHVEESTSFIQPDENGKLPEAWAVHQLFTTSNFAMKNRLFTWFVGGLNYQVEHHLFPHVSHIHYRKLSKLVRNTAKEFGLPYHHRRTFVGAVYHHMKLLKRLGQPA